ncbi:MAG TPA: hypothetical protein VE933_05230, partial [Chitinophagaceae bacterium]|nr:hypothetical protein [Chitinophagaceae bacterium]
MTKLIFLCVLLAAATACNTSGNSEPTSASDTGKQETNSAATPTTNIALPALPNFVAFKNWQMGDPAKTSLIIDVYRLWDAANTD